jgi:hypothetical protein
LILHSVQGSADGAAAENCQGLDAAKYDELTAQRPVRLVFRRKFSDLIKQTPEEAAAAAAAAVVAGAGGQHPRGLGLAGLVGAVVGPAVSGFGVNHPGAPGLPSPAGAGGVVSSAEHAKANQDLAATREELAARMAELTEERAQLAKVKMELAGSKGSCLAAEAEYELADVAQQELLDVNQQLRAEGTRLYERERRLKVKGEQVQFVNGELRQRLQALADHYDEARRTHQQQIDQLQDVSYLDISVDKSLLWRFCSKDLVLL